MKTGEARGRPSWESSFLGDPGAKFFCRKRENGPNQEGGQENEAIRLANMYRHRSDRW
jgi:hypothetical protein